MAIPVEPTLVMKFGGTTVDGADGLGRVTGILRRRPRGTVAVVSAMAGVTNLLLQGAEAAARGDRTRAREVAEEVRRRHLEAAGSALATDPLRRYQALTDRVLCEFRSLSAAIDPAEESADRRLEAAASLGEVLSTQLVTAALREQGVPARAQDAVEILVTDDHPAAAVPVVDASRERVRRHLGGALAAGELPVMTGFRAGAPDGSCTTLGRGGSDFSATLVAALLPASEAWIWTDVDGILSADPRVVPEAKVLPEVSYAEAIELSFFGTKVLHPSAIRPAAGAGIPVRIKNSHNPLAEGTRIGEPRGGPAGVRAISLVDGASLLTLHARVGVSLNLLAAQVFGALAESRITTLLVTQSSAEDVICVAMPGAERRRAERAISAAAPGVAGLESRTDVGMVVAVGDAMRGTPGVAGTMFSALGQLGINVVAISQGSSELAVAAVLAQEDLHRAARALHRAFRL